jgi:hypothetical protein
MENNYEIEDLLELGIDLTDEEKTIIEKLDKKISSILEKKREEYYENIDDNLGKHFNDKHPGIAPPKGVTQCQHEIRITTIGQVYEVDENGYVSQTKEMYRKFYHIPVGVGSEHYETYIEKFFNTFEEKLTATCKEYIKTEEKDTENN